MFLVRKSHSTPVLFVLAGMLLVTACVVDKSYDIKPSDIDLTVTLLEDGLTVPIGSSDKISLGDLINSAGEGINDIIETGSNGELILKYEGSTSLNDQLAELDLGSKAVIDGVDFSQSFSYHLGDFNTEQFCIESQTLDMTVKLGTLDLVNVKPASISASVSDFHAGLDGFKDVISGNENLDLSKTIGNVHYNQDFLSKQTVLDAVNAYPEQLVVPVPSALVSSLDLTPTNVSINVEPVKLDQNVKRISNIVTNPNAKLVVSIEMEHPFFIEGDMTPEITIDFSSLLKIKGGSNLDLSSMVLTKGNNWATTKTFDVEGLCTTEFEGAFSLDGSIPIGGKVTVSNAKTSKGTVQSASGDMGIAIDLHFENLTIDSADLALEMDPVSPAAETVSLGGFAPTPLPTSISDVKKIIMDESKTITLSIKPAGLNLLNAGAKLPYEFTVDFPSSLKVKDAVNGKLSFTGDLVNGEVTQQIILQEIYPTVSNGSISLDADVTVSASVTPQDLVINSAKLPQSPNEDLSFSVSLAGEPTIKDYLLVIKTYDERADIQGSIEVEADGLGSFSGVHIVPQGSPALTIDFNIPTLKGLNLKPGQEGIKITLPEFLVFKASEIDASLNFNASENSIMLRNEFPNQAKLPIKELYVKPVKEGGKTLIKGGYSVAGSAAIPGAEISQADLEEIFGTDFGFAVNIPEIKAASISLDDNLSVDIDQKFDLTVKNIPEELKKIEEVLLDDVYVNLEAAFEGLPGSTPFTVDLTFTLPEFISPNVIPIKGKVVNGKLSATPVKLEKLYNIEPTKIKDAKTGEEYNGLKGNIEIKGSISADGANFNVSELQSDITASVTASIKNKDGKIGLAKASGVFSYEIEEETSLELDSLPEELSGDNLCLDFADPRLNLDISTNLGMPMSATLELIPYVNGVAVEANKVSINNVQLPHSATAATTTEKKYTICKAASSAPAGRDFIEADISKLLKQIPEKLTVKIVAGVDPTQTSVLEPSAAYTLDLAYGINVPLSFGKDFSFTTDTELDLSGAASVVSMGDFGIKGKVLNDSPLNLSIQFDLLDPDGNVVPQSKSSSINIAGAKTSDFEIYLSPADKSREIKSAKLTIKVTAIPDVPVKNSDCLQFLDLVAVSANGITVNPSK